MNITNPLGTPLNPSNPIKEETNATSSEALSLQEQCNNKGIEVFNKLSESFANWYAIAPIMAKEVSSENFGRYLRCLETCIQACEHACKGSTNTMPRETI